LFGYTSVMPIAVPKKKKRSLLPLLTVLFLFSYGLMTVLIVEQGSAIQSQRNLIKVLLHDSTELWAMKGKTLIDQQMARAQAQTHAQAPSTQAPAPSVQAPSSQTPSTQNPSTQTPSTQTPSTQSSSTQASSTQAPSTQTPSTQVQKRHSPTQAGKVAKPEAQVPPMPASDIGDQRRALRTI
jgi:D-alanyl-D-alanine carboxypeptidase